MENAGIVRAHGDLSKWDQALYAFLAEKERRSGSRRRVESYSRMLQKIETALTPAETMAPWLREAREEHRSLADPVQSLRSQPDEAWPLFQLTSQAEAAAKERLKSEAGKLAGFSKLRSEFVERGERTPSAT